MAETVRNVYPLCMAVILYLDSDIVIVSKAAGEAVETKRGDQRSITTSLRETLGDTALQPVHRIDQPVTGLVVYGRRKAAIASFHEQFATGAVLRRYIAIVTQAPDPPEGSLVDQIVVDGSENRSHIVTDDTKGTAKTARLHYRTVGSTKHHTVLFVTLESGRHHQIRAQFAHRGWHILGDAKYGARRPMRDRSIGLHAREIVFVHPRLGDTMHVIAPFPSGSLWNAVREVTTTDLPEDGSLSR